MALGLLHWTPETFWNATFHEITTAYIGHCRVNGIGPFSKDKVGMTAAKVAHLQNWFEEERSMENS